MIFLVGNFFPWEIGDCVGSTSGEDSSSSFSGISNDIQAAYYDDDIVGSGLRHLLTRLIVFDFD